LICILEVQEMRFGDITVDIIKRENLPHGPDIALVSTWHELVVAPSFALPEVKGTRLEQSVDTEVGTGRLIVHPKRMCVCARMRHGSFCKAFQTVKTTFCEIIYTVL